MIYSMEGTQTNEGTCFTFGMNYPITVAELVTLPLDLVATKVETDTYSGGTITLHTNDLRWLKMVIENARDAQD